MNLGRSTLVGHAAVAVMLTCFGACAPRSGPLEVEVLAIDPQSRDYRLERVTVNRVVDIETAQHQDFDVVGSWFLAVAPGTEVPGAPRTVVATRARQAPKEPVRPALSYDGAYVALDYESFTYLHILAYFERAFDFYRDVIGDRSNATTPTHIGMHGGVSIAGLTIPALDNAAYFPRSDTWNIDPTLLQGQIPLALHPAVVAHEFGHRIFNHNVFPDARVRGWRAYSGIHDEPPDGFSRMGDEEAVDKRTSNLLSGLDEGLADLFAIGFVEDTTWPRDCLDGDDSMRDILGAYAGEATYERLESDWVASGANARWACFAAGDGDSTPVGFDADGFNFYCIGTVIARALFDGSGRDFRRLRVELLPRLLTVYDRLGAYLDARVNERGGFDDFDLDVFFEFLVDETPTADRAELCAALRPRFATRMAVGVPSCAGF